MSLKQPILDIITKLKEIPDLKFVKIFNNQFEYMESQEMYEFPFPCAFVEAIAPQQYNQLGGGYQQADVDFRIHIGQDQYDAGSGDMEQNTTIFDLRDLVYQKLALYRPTMCTELVKTNEFQDYKHTNLYKYIIEFRTGYIDKTASTLITPVIVDPINIEIDAFFVRPSFDEGFNEDFAINTLEPDIDRHEIITS